MTGYCKGGVSGAFTVAMVTVISLAVTGPGAAHPFNVFTRSDCVTLTVIVSINDGDPVTEGAVTLLNGANVVVATTELIGETGRVEVPLEGLDTTGGIRTEVVSGAHSDYWVLTPEDLARKCSS